MFKYKINFIALSDSIVFEIMSESKEMIEEFIQGLLLIFSRVEDSGDIIIESFQKNSPETRQKIDLYTDKYKSIIPQINGVPAFYRKLKENEAYFVIPNMQTETIDKLKFYNYLQTIEKGKSFEEINGQTKYLFGELLKKYQIAVFGDKRILIGEPIKSNRKCRFCNNEKQNISFNNKAHAISEGLGNKTIVLYDECDICNSDFSKTIEPDIIQYLSLYRTLYDVKGKGGSKQFLGKNFKITNEENVKIVLNSDEDIFNEKFSLPYNLKLQTKNPIRLQNIYKCFCKYFLSVIDSKYLVEFQKTIDWINGKVKIDSLPKIVEITSYQLDTKQPKIATYIRKENNTQLPYAVGEFHFTCKVFAFIIPLSNKDNKDFTQITDYEIFWNTFKQYKNKKFTFIDFSNNEPRKYIMDLKIESNDKPNNSNSDEAKSNI